ncbi:MAG: hypothetical protein KDC95_07535 [Planctomycetes bacterium]|nr:hypothetical protein [Planctomycetota bacterium]
MTHDSLQLWPNLWARTCGWWLLGIGFLLFATHRCAIQEENIGTKYESFDVRDVDDVPPTSTVFDKRMLEHGRLVMVVPRVSYFRAHRIADRWSAALGVPVWDAKAASEETAT